ncbi:hypothetical protein [Vibrio harveyi]|uniref:hypothetical protein n=1 Tax=Vibrio harveyi TaxID=669 RepID=UPI003BB5432D
MKYDGRQNKYLHESVQVLFLDFDEVKFIGFLYALALAFDVGILYLNIIILPIFVIPYKRKQSRGFFGQFLYSMGFYKLHGYPIPEACEFYE